MRPKLEKSWACLAVVAAVGATACDDGPVVDADAVASDADVPGEDSRDDGEAGADGDVVDGGADADAEVANSGPMTFVASSFGLLPDRHFDVDGDGRLDNCIADLGSPASDLLSGAISAAMQGSIEDGRRRVVFHLPWVDDLSGPNDPDLLLIPTDGRDLDVPRDIEDDFSGEEPFYARGEYLDGCGEPRFFSREIAIVDGDVTVGPFNMIVPVGDGVLIEGAQGTGSISPRGRTFGLIMAGYVSIGDFGETDVDFEGVNGLEFLLAGGAPHGLPSVSGVTPDIDVDGDGLEWMVLDEDHRVDHCIDGDNTVLPGRECWRDDRMADAFSVTFSVEFVPASFAGPEPGWEELAVGECDAPPVQSLWDER